MYTLLWTDVHKKLHKKDFSVKKLVHVLYLFATMKETKQKVCTMTLAHAFMYYFFIQYMRFSK